MVRKCSLRGVQHRDARRQDDVWRKVKRVMGNIENAKLCVSHQHARIRDDGVLGRRRERVEFCQINRVSRIAGMGRLDREAEDECGEDGVEWRGWEWGMSENRWRTVLD